jgi:thiol-disulfide isomerase/thioredoxin
MRVVVCSLLVLVHIFTAVSCTKSSAPAEPTTTTTTTPAAHGAGPVFIEDDLDAAVARARGGAGDARKLIVVDAWAPWCHTCLSMQREVLSRPELVAFEDRVVFVAIDTDREKNAAFVAAHPLRVWPTFFVLDPATPLGAPIAARPGSMSLEETMAFITAALSRSMATADAAAAARAHSAFAAGDKVFAVKAFDEAIALSSADPLRRREYVVQSAWIRTATDDAAGCLAFIDAQRAFLSSTTSPGGVLFDIEGATLSCAGKLPAGPAKSGAIAGARARLEALIKAPPTGAAVDDIADGMATLADVVDQGYGDVAGDHAAATAIHEARLALLEADAQKATTERGAQVHDYARMNSLVFLGRVDDAITLLSARAKALPRDYEPKARLASALLRAKRYDDARAAAGEAVMLSYGPRRLRYLMMLADIEKGAGNVDGEQGALRRVVADGAALPEAMRLPSVTAAAQARLAPAQPAQPAP